MAFPQAVVTKAAEQLGLLTRRQLIHELHVPPDTVDCWLRRGWLERLERGVYRVRGGCAPRAQELLAAVLRVPGPAALSGWTGCALHGIEGCELTDPAWVVAAPTSRVTGVAFVVQLDALRDVDLRTVDGLPTVTPFRALVDLALRANPRALRVAVADARRRGLVSLPALVERCGALPGHAGAQRLLQRYGQGEFDQDGEGEHELAAVLARGGITLLWQVEILPGIVVDGCLPEASITVEFDGQAHHSLGIDVAADATREAHVKADGWQPVHVSTEDLRSRPEELVAEIAALRARRMALGLGRRPGWKPVSPPGRLRPERPERR